MLKLKNNGVFFIIIACFLWGVDTLIRYPLVFSGQSIAQIVFWEHLIVLFLFSPFIVSTFRKIRGNSFYWGLFVLLGMGGSAAATLMFTKAFSLSHPTVVVLIQKTQPIFALLLAKFWLKETFSKRFYYLAPLAFLGAIILISEDLQKLNHSQVGFEASSLLGYVYAFGASLLWGGATVVGRYLSLKGFEAREMTTMRVFFATLFFIPYFVFCIDFSSLIPSVQVLGKIGLLSFLSGVLGLSLYYKGLKRTRARYATLAEMTFPIWVIALNWVILGQSISLVQITGATILLFSIYVLQNKKQVTV